MDKNKRTKKEYLRIFLQYDADNSGSVSMNEIIKMFNACELEIDQEEVEDLMNEIDADGGGGGELEQDEFIEFLKRQDQKIEYSTEQCKRLFEYFVTEGQSIGFEQLKELLECLGEKVSDTEVSKMIIYGDKNCDGRLDFNQFSKMIMML